MPPIWRPPARKPNEFKGLCSFSISLRGPVLVPILEPRIPELSQNSEELLKANWAVPNLRILDSMPGSKALERWKSEFEKIWEVPNCKLDYVLH